MKRYLFSIFITIVSLLAVYLFYIFWHTPVSPVIATPPKSNKPVPLQEPTASKDIFRLDNNESIESDVGEMPPEEMEQKQQATEATFPPMPTTQEQERQTQEIYEALTPEEHEETLSEAQEAFDKLDQTVIEIDEKLALELEAVEQSRIEAGEPTTEGMIEANTENAIDIPEETMQEEFLEQEDLPKVEEVTLDPSQEDVNNL